MGRTATRSSRLAGVLSLPHVGQELVELGDGRLGDVGQDACEAGLRIEAMAFGAGDEAIKDGRVGGGQQITQGWQEVKNGRVPSASGGRHPATSLKDAEKREAVYKSLKGEYPDENVVK